MSQIALARASAAFSTGAQEGLAPDATGPEHVRVHDALRPILDDQAGVVSRRQARDAGLAPHDLARLLRRRELVRLHEGVFLAHTGEPTWLQRSWGAVLVCWPAALSHSSALRAAEGPGGQRPERVIEVAVANDRTPVRRPVVVVHRLRNLDDRVLWHTSPPRVRHEEAALDVAAGARSDVDALAELARVVQGRRTTAARLAPLSTAGSASSVGLGCRRSSRTSPRAPARSWSTATSTGWSGPTGSPAPAGRPTTGSAPAPCTTT